MVGRNAECHLVILRDAVGVSGPDCQPSLTGGVVCGAYLQSRSNISRKGVEAWLAASLLTEK